MTAEDIFPTNPSETSGDMLFAVVIVVQSCYGPTMMMLVMRMMIVMIYLLMLSSTVAKCQLMLIIFGVLTFYFLTIPYKHDIYTCTYLTAIFCVILDGLVAP